MSVLVVALPPRPRTPAAAAPPAAWPYVWSGNGQQAERSGHAALDLLPRADTLVAVLPVQDLSWQRTTLPRSPANRLRAALAGALEDTLLEEPETLHFALPPAPVPGAETWVAVTDRRWLAAQLAALESGGRTVDRVVPEAAPVLLAAGVAVGSAGSAAIGAAAPGAAGPAQAVGHFQAADAVDFESPQLDAAGAAGPATGPLSRTDADQPSHLLLSTPAGCCRLPLAGAAPGVASAPAWRALLPAPDSAVRWSASPALAGAAERWLELHGYSPRVELVNDAQQRLALAASPWNLRQFELLPQLRGTRAVRDALRRVASPAWRPFRWGVAALVGLQLVGLNAWAWQQERALQHKRDAVVSLLKTTHPQVRAVLDAPLQMQRETERLRTAAGRAGDGDFETLLAAAAAAWPPGLAAAQSLRYEGGQLFFNVPGAAPQHADALRDRLRGQGLGAQLVDNRLRVQREGAAVSPVATPRRPRALLPQRSGHEGPRR